MEDWYAQLIANGDIPANKKLTVTGYSLGGHLANAFGMLRQEQGKSPDLFDIITFNGAGTGLVNEGTLTEQLATFNNAITNDIAGKHSIKAESFSIPLYRSINQPLTLLN